MFWSQFALKQRECPLGSPPPFYGFKGSSFCLYQAKFLCNVYLNHHRIPSEWNLKSLLYLLEIYSKYIHRILIFPLDLVKLVPLWNQCLHVMLCRIKLMELTETWILPFYFYSTFSWARETIKSNVKLNTSIKKYPTLQSHLNTTCESR